MDQLEDTRSMETAQADKDVLERRYAAPRADCTVLRTKLLETLHSAGAEAGMCIICAPSGFGKTTLLLQYAAMVKDDVERSQVRILDAESMDADQLGRALVACGEELEPAMRPLVAIDNLPELADDAMEQLIVLFRALRERGFEIVVTCTPSNNRLVEKMGDSVKIGAQALLVQPREYPEWAHAFSIASTLDVYELTQGVPALVVLLQSVTGRRGGCVGLELGAADLYRDMLEPLRAARDPLYRLLCSFLLMGWGCFGDLDAAGMHVREASVSRVCHDYPVFGLNAEARTFSCLAPKSKAMDSLRKEIAGYRPALVPKTMRMLMRANRVDDVVRLATQLLDVAGSLEIIGQYPAQFALTGNAVFVHQMASCLNGEDVLRSPVGVILAVYLAALTMGEYRLARAMCATLRRRANEIESGVDAQAWMTARALSALWAGCNGIELPRLSAEYERVPTTGPAVALRQHLDIYSELLAGAGEPNASAYPAEDEVARQNEVDVPDLLLRCDRALDDALHSSGANLDRNDQLLQDGADLLAARHLGPLVVRVRMTAAICRLLAGKPMVDERAFNDAGTVAVREADFSTQLFCLLGEGWQALATSQVVNGRFRGQQVLKLADESQRFLRSWALLLERTAYLLNTSQVTIRDEAELLDLAQDTSDPATAWSVALHLSAAHYDSELSAWFSLHKELLLDERFCPMARLAMHLVGERADSVRKLLPRRCISRYQLSDDAEPQPSHLFEVGEHSGFSSIGQVNICLFGGFRVERNGHVLTDEIWRRKKASIAAARLALSLGSFVSRRVITEELWPATEYGRARENLYVTLSTLRSAFGQREDGPQYVLTQGEGVALNNEFVASDTSRFDLLAREILLKRNGVSGRQIIEAALKLEQLYTGPLYVPDSGDSTFFLRMRRVYLSRFVDCMLRGIDVALEADDLHSASWLSDAALRHAPMREDVVRHAMRVYDLTGRRREVVELYNSHMYLLEQELNAVPDEETVRTYEEIINHSKLVNYL